MSSEFQEKFEQPYTEALVLTNGDHSAAATLVLADRLGGIEHQLVSLTDLANSLAKTEKTLLSIRNAIMSADQGARLR